MYKHVAILGVDGMGAFNGRTDTPNFDKLFANGAVTYDALTARPTISAECWGAMLLGIDADVHKLTNSIVDKEPYPVDSVYPSVFRVVHELYPDAKLAAFSNWSPINRGIIEANLGVTTGTGNDQEVCDAAIAYLEENEPVLLFMQFDEVDGMGHKFGYGTPQHLAWITRTDDLIGQVVDKYAEKGYDDTLFIVSADHGGTPQRGHGGDTDAEKLIFIGVAGKTVQKGVIAGMQVKDIAAIAATALGAALPAAWSGRVPAEVSL
ncbi:MAG: alkaline phosphatase family protein [Oscillospiraceae bacterium]|jgi:hypothetical protein|nr:alkaline phosphatase family protein [Oscillospiraceae bacterium]